MPTPILSPYAARGRSSYRNRGSGDYLRLTSGLPASGSWTACGWMLVRPRASTYHYFLGLSDSLASATNENILGRTNSNVSEIYSSVGSAQFSTDWFGTSGARLFVVFGASGTGANQMFARVRQVTSLAFNESITGQIASYTPAAFWIGNDSYDEWTDHSFWNVRLWGRALSAAEALRESFSAQPASRDGLIGWWPLEGNTEQLLRDYSGNGRHLTRAGTPRAEPFFLPASVLMPLVDDAAVDAAAGGGAMVGTASLAFTPSGAMAGTGALAGSSTLTFTPASALTGTGAIAGSSAITFTPSATAQAIAAASGTAAMSFSPAGSMVGDGALAGTSALSFAPIGALTGIGDIAAQSQLVFTPSGTLTAANQGDISGAAAMAFAATGALTGDGALAGSAQMTFTATARADQPQSVESPHGFAMRRDLPIVDVPRLPWQKKRQEHEDPAPLVKALPKRVRRAAKRIAEQAVESVALERRSEAREAAYEAERRQFVDLLARKADQSLVDLYAESLFAQLTREAYEAREAELRRLIQIDAQERLIALDIQRQQEEEALLLLLMME